MKRISFLLIASTLCATGLGRAQDAATEERLNKLSGQIEDLIAGQKVERERIATLAKEIENLSEQISKPAGNYAAQEDLKHLTEAVKEVDRKRIEDSEKVQAQLMKISKIASAPTPTPKKSTPVTPPDQAPTEKSTSPEKGYKYTIQKNDTISVIVQAYRDKNIKVTTDQILKANPGLNPNRLRVGQEIFIPAPQS